MSSVVVLKRFAWWKWLSSCMRWVCDKNLIIQWHSFAQYLTAKICLDRTLIAISSVNSCSRSFRSQDQMIFCIDFISLWNYSLSFDLRRPDVEEKGFIDSYKKKKPWTDILDSIVMQIYWDQVRLTIVHCFAVQNNELFLFKKKAPAKPENDNFQPISVKTYNSVRGSTRKQTSTEKEIELLDAFLVKISSNKASSNRFIDWESGFERVIKFDSFHINRACIFVYVFLANRRFSNLHNAI